MRGKFYNNLTENIFQVKVLQYFCKSIAKSIAAKKKYCVQKVLSDFPLDANN